jgi:hypothetical protein
MFRASNGPKKLHEGGARAKACEFSPKLRRVERPVSEAKFLRDLLRREHYHGHRVFFRQRARSLYVGRGQRGYNASRPVDRSREVNDALHGVTCHLHEPRFASGMSRFFESDPVTFCPPQAIQATAFHP